MSCKPQIGVVLINYNRPLIERCFKSVINQSYKNLVITLVDNSDDPKILNLYEKLGLINSMDKTKITNGKYDRFYIKESKINGITTYFIKSKENLLCKAYYEGTKFLLKNTDVDAITYCDDDGYFEENTIKNLIEFYSVGDVLTTIKLLINTKTYQGLGYIEANEHIYFPLKELREKITPPAIKKISFSPPQGLLVKRPLFEKENIYLGMEDIFYCEDVDFCYRLNLKKIPIYLISKSAIFHPKYLIDNIYILKKILIARYHDLFYRKYFNYPEEYKNKISEICRKLYVKSLKKRYNFPEDSNLIYDYIFNKPYKELVSFIKSRVRAIYNAKINFKEKFIPLGEDTVHIEDTQKIKANFSYDEILDIILNTKVKLLINGSYTYFIRFLGYSHQMGVLEDVLQKIEI